MVLMLLFFCFFKDVFNIILGVDAVVIIVFCCCVSFAVAVVVCFYLLTITTQDGELKLLSFHVVVVFHDDVNDKLSRCCC